MEQELRTQRSLPPLSETVLVAWERALCVTTDLTVSRRELQQTVGAAWLRAGAPVDVGELLLVYEKLAANAVRHGRSPVCVRVVARGRGWFVDVAYAAVERPPVPAVGRDPADGGMGLHVVARLWRAHGWTVDDGRKHVWACVAAA
jgi:hypothetical protein